VAFLPFSLPCHLLRYSFVVLFDMHLVVSIQEAPEGRIVAQARRRHLAHRRSKHGPFGDSLWFCYKYLPGNGHDSHHPSVSPDLGRAPVEPFQREGERVAYPNLISLL
jgi:hypothetical protein